VRLEISTSSKKGLILGIDDIHIGSNDNETCSDYIIIQGSDSKDKTKWCRNNKTDISGEEFPGQSHIDIGFHAGNASNSSFTLIVTEFEAPSFGYCFSNKNLKCSSKAGKQCVSKAYQCDGYRNCPEGDDENGCHYTPITTTTPSNHTTPPTTPSTTPRTKPTTPPTTTPSPKPEPKGLGGGIIALIVIGVLIAAAIVVFVIFKCLKRRRENNGYSAVNSD